MSDLFENNQDKILDTDLADENISEENEKNVDDSESTVFSAPTEHKDSKKAKSKNLSKIITVIVACVAVAAIIVGTVIIEDNVEVIDDGNVVSEAVFEDIPLIDKDASTFTAVEIKNDTGTYKFTTKQITSTNDDGKTQTKKYWSVDDIDISKLSSTAVEEIITNAASISAKLEVTKKNKEECGFTKPLITVKVTDPKNGDFGFVVADKSPDGLGYYFAKDGEDKIYVVPTNELSSFIFEPIDLTDKTSIPATMFETDTSANKLADGSYGYFDTLTLSGTLFPETITFVNNNEKTDTAEIVPYLVTTPKNMSAQKENVTSLLTLFSKTINVAGNFAIDTNAETLKKFGLDEPDAIVTMTINGESKSFKFSIVDEEFCAVIYDGATMIRKVTADSFAFLSLKPEDFYYKQPFMNSMSDIASIELVNGEEKVKFELSYTEDSTGVKTFFSKVNGQAIEIGIFQNFYESFVDTRCTGFTVEEPTIDAESTLTIKFNSEKSSEIKFYAISAIEYQFSINGEQIGKIAASSYQKMVRNFTQIAADAVK